MNSAEELCHSSGPWKKHKYFQKIGEGANAIYRYAKKGASDTAGKLTGSYYDKEAEKYEKDAEFYGDQASKHFVNATKDAARERTPQEDARYEDYWRKEKELMNRNMRKETAADMAARLARRKSDNAPLKSLKGETAKSIVSKGEKIIKDLFNPPAKVTSTHTFFEGKGSTSKKTKTNPDGSKVTVSTTIYPRKKK